MLRSSLCVLMDREEPCCPWQAWDAGGVCWVCALQNTHLEFMPPAQQPRNMEADPLPFQSCTFSAVGRAEGVISK